MIPKIVLGLFIISTFIQILYWIFMYVKLQYRPQTSVTKSSNPVTTIICAKNEATNLEKNLHRILNQNYHLHRLLLVNDNSTDTTPDVLLKIQKNHKTFTFVNADKAPAELPGKKAALTKGIEHADTDVLLMTDADCYPASSDWAEIMQSQISGKTEIVLGFSPYEKKKGWLNKLIRFDTVLIALQYFTMALAGMPYMGVGRNIAYRKSLFERTGGFEKHKSLASGDDDLFVQQAATATNTKICLDQDSFMFSEPKNSWKAYFIQKARHLTTGKTYKIHHQFILAMFLMSLFVHMTGGIGLLSQSLFIHIVIVCMILRLAVAWGVFGKLAGLLKSEDLTRWYLPLETSYLLFNIILTPTLLTFKPTKWK